MAVGPCGPEFREAFSCFHYSKEEPKGSDCLPKFAEMQECMKQHPDLYEERKTEDKDADEAPKTDEGEPAAKEPEVAVVDSPETGAKEEEETKSDAETTPVKDVKAAKEDPSEPAGEAVKEDPSEPSKDSEEVKS